jgi:plasmid stabilization system protein ParE
MAFSVDFTRKADRDVEDQLAWWRRLGRAAPDRWHARFLAKVIATLEADPHQFLPADEAADLGIDLRVMLYGRQRQVYRVLFTVEGDRVIVHRVRHAAQDRLTGDDI